MNLRSRVHGNRCFLYVLSCQFLYSFIRIQLSVVQSHSCDTGIKLSLNTFQSFSDTAVVGLPLSITR